jgi:phospholipid transport system transporter-binding protein
VNQITVEQADTWRVSGELSFATVGALLTEFTERAASSPPKVLDLSEVTRTDSAGLALLIEWVKQTKQAPITFHNLPVQMLNLAKVSGVQEMLTHAESQ